MISGLVKSEAFDKHRMWEAITSSITGAIIWEVIRSTCGQIFKHRRAKAESRRNFLRAQLRDVEKQLQPLVELAMDYYGAPSHVGATKIRSIEIALNTLDLACDSLNKKLEKINLEPIGLAHLISFRQNLIAESNVPRSEALASSDPVLRGILVATQRLRDAIQDRNDALA